MDVTAAHKTEIERKILEAIINAFENNQVAEAELPTISDFVLTRIDQIQDHEQLVKFLDELSAKWPFFDNIEQLERGEVTEAKEDQIEQKVLEMAKSGKVDEAINLAKTVTEK